MMEESDDVNKEGIIRSLAPSLATGTKQSQIKLRIDY
jgi:hypothetical protein